MRWGKNSRKAASGGRNSPSESVYIGLGSNLENREANVKEAVRRVAAIDGVKVWRVSSMYETEPVGGPPQPWYCNAVLEAETVLPPEELLAALQGIEAAMGRTRGERNGPRVIDLDILFLGGRIIAGDRLTVPHPRLCGRRFVLEPLAEIAAGFIHPVRGVTVRELLERVGSQYEVIRKGTPHEP